MKGFPKGRIDRTYSSRGVSMTGCLSFLLIFLVLAYLGLKFGEAAWDYLNLRQKTKETLNWAVAEPAKTEAQILQKMIANALEVQIELAPRNIQIKQTGETLTLVVSWIRYVELPYYTYPWNIRISQSDIKRWGRGGLVIK
jgi:hypothetical protein